MNGSWYAWGMQPEEYIKAYRIMAKEIHRQAPAAGMLWSPNSGNGYPFGGGRVPLPGTKTFDLLDTNGDGILDMSDGMYAPFYPGDDAVDWVGLTAYHWGIEYPWGANVIPPAGSAVQQIAGGGVMPDFYHVYAEQHGKPMAITETAALYNPSRVGADELTIKQTWWRQLYSPAFNRRFPNVKLITWFEYEKYEGETNSIINWTLTYTPEVAAAFRRDISGWNHILFAPEPAGK